MGFQLVNKRVECFSMILKSLKDVRVCGRFSMARCWNANQVKKTKAESVGILTYGFGLIERYGAASK